jgi:hypothetical protein
MVVVTNQISLVKGIMKFDHNEGFFIPDNIKHPLLDLDTQAV